MPIELPQGQRLQLVSYLGSGSGQKYLMAAVPYYIGGRQEGYRVVLRPASVIRDHTASFFIESHPEGFRLRWAQDQSWFLTRINVRQQLVLASASNFLAVDYSVFAIDAVKDKNWFALNDYSHKWVADVSGSATADNSSIITWEWNGGDNQIWRTEIPMDMRPKD